MRGILLYTNPPKQLPKQTVQSRETCPAQAAAGSKHPRTNNASNVPHRLTSACTLPCTIHRPWQLQPSRPRACWAHCCNPARRRTNRQGRNQARSRRPNPSPLVFTPCACRSPPGGIRTHQRCSCSSSSVPNTLDTLNPHSQQPPTLSTPLTTTSSLPDQPSTTCDNSTTQSVPPLNPILQPTHSVVLGAWGRHRPTDQV